jgi:TonB family protein
VAALVVSAALHVGLGLPLREALPRLLARAPTPGGEKAPVDVVPLAPGTYEKILARAREVAPGRRRPAEARKDREKKKRKKKREREDELKGQVVETEANRKKPPKDAKYLAKEDNRVERETIARPELRDDSRERVTNELQDAASKGGKKRGVPVPGLESSGGAKEEREGPQGKGEAEQPGQFRLQMPKLARRQGVDLDIAKLPELAPNRVWNRESIDAVPGQSDDFQIGGDPRARGGKAGGRRRGKDGEASGLPSLEDLRPTLGTVARISGSPSDDYVENVPEGDGTFLNTRAFKYATFFYQVRDSVGAYWKSDVREAMRRRDPTGDVYGPGNLKTLLFVRHDDSGDLSEVRVEESSGYDFLDDVAVRAFEQAKSFPNPPAGIIDENGFIAFRFSFVLFTGRRGPLNIFR